MPSLMESLNDPAMRHAMMVHWPIVLACLGAVMALASLLVHKRRVVRGLAVACLAGAMVSGFVAMNSGEDAHEAAEGPGLTRAAHDLLHEHEEMGEKVWPLCLLSALLLAAGLAKNTWLKWGGGLLGTAGSLAAVLVVSNTAHMGGVLVYEHGVGMNVATPELPLSDPSRDESDDSANVGSASDADVRFVVFRRDVQPTLEGTCMKCHNPNRAGRSAGLDLTSREAALRGGHSGSAFIEGKPSESLLIKAIRHEIPEVEMPPKKPKLGDEVIAAFEKWIADGAVWEVSAASAMN